ncbi:MAG: hypothetical protein WKF89_02250 [Chitinophagaceae bacterium]
MSISPPGIKKFILPAVIFFSLLVLSLVYWKGYGKPNIGIDDANIYFVYMKHLAEGHGFVWNIGGERVEGFTSLLWTLIGALFYKISPLNLPLFFLIFGFTLSFFTIYKVLEFARKINNTESAAITATDIIILFLLIAPRGYIEWNILGLMETSLWSFLLALTSLMLCNYYFNQKKINIVGFSVMLILINLTRPESIAFNFLFILILFVMLYADYGWRYSLKKSLVPFLSYAISLGALILWRLSYFGYPLPNTYYAKVSGSEKGNLIGGLGYLFQFFNNFPLAAFIFPLLLFFGFMMLIKWKKSGNLELYSNQEKVEAVLLSVVFSGLAFPVLTGGDHFHFSRFYQPLLPLFYLAVTITFFWRNYIGFMRQGTRIATAVVVVSLVFAAFFSGKSTVFGFFRDELLNFPEFEIARAGRQAAVEMNQAFADCKAYPSMGTNATGGFGYIYKGTTMDMLGLNSTLMAHANTIKTGVRNHASFDKKAFWQMKPDVFGTSFGGEVVYDTSTFVLYENVPGYRHSDFIYSSYKKIFDDDDFRAAYMPAFVQHKNDKYFIFGYYATSFLNKLDNSIYNVQILERIFDPHRPDQTKR